MTPDPANAGVVAGNPQSWNAYSYVINSPETFIDPTGRLYCIVKKLSNCISDSVFKHDPAKYRGYIRIYLDTSVTVNGRTGLPAATEARNR